MKSLIFFLTAEAPIHDRLQFPDFKTIDVRHKILGRLDSSDIAGKFPAAQRKHRTLPAEHVQTDPRKIAFLTCSSRISPDVMS